MGMRIIAVHKEELIMRKADLVEKLSEKINQTKKETTVFVDEFVAIIVEALQKGDEVVLPEMGKFLVKKRPARTARNPITGAEVKVEAKIVPQFKPNKKFKEAVVA